MDEVGDGSPVGPAEMSSRASAVLVRDLADAISRATPTPPGDVRCMIDWLYRRVAATATQWQVEEFLPGQHNALATWNFGLGPTLCLNTHLDVNAVTGQTWAFGPFEATVRGDRLFGRGACDAKASLVSMVAACLAVAGRPSGARGRVVLTAVGGEEAGGLGSLALVKGGFHADAAVVGEPTGLTVMTGHKGTFMRRVHLSGIAAHSGRPDLGHNALHDLGHLIAAIADLDDRLAANPHAVVGRPSAQVTLAQGGTQQNTLPAAAEVLFDRRLVPGETHEGARQELASILQELGRRWPGFGVAAVDEVVATLPSWTPTRERIVRVALEARNLVVAQSPQGSPGGFPAGCDMSKLRGMLGIPTVILGPGSLAQAHGPDEYVAIPQLLDAARIYEHIIRAYLDPRVARPPSEPEEAVAGPVAIERRPRAP